MVIKVKKIQNAFRNHLFFLRMKEKNKAKQIEKLSWFKENQNTFRKQYRVKELTSKIKY